MRRALVAIAALLIVGCADFKLVVANVASTGGAFTATENVAYGSEPRQKLDIYHPHRGPHRGPRSTDGERLPVVVFFHGGGWTSDSKDQYRFVGAALAEKDWLAIVPSYRVYPKVRFPAFVEDAALAVKWVREHASEYGGDPERIFVMGHSSGAHLALMIVLDRRYLAAIGSSADDIKGVIGLSGPYDFLPFRTVHFKRVFAGTKDLHDTQPIRFARADAPPALLVHGSADTVVLPQNSVNLAQAIERLGGRVTLKIYEGRNHGDVVAGFSSLRHGDPPVLSDIAQFIEKNLD
jgi:acetyl esterase/lipase